ncbi:hypothetical protein MEO40_04930 [Dolichospermum sp. ST_sed1]|nr:hypothetical protein [Dolichospermum sp. ST_sed1]MDD1425469.1 hypothetical protein [Dolichospermum sp. ST_sed9]MDD1432040.1 hypothetical protein [Dolichospermum sp. ST_sed6]MDD1441426.1 hypothetical protein [Dolichospermum sp. ST_sed3]MDD1447219.1 hypothetical protein [Dolichospermum sp. ST_sed8]MDD1455541.1 hypothetical protein [Dolichospermum sp. ST_sed7]MDD1461365.1 hypothetical protein [Dolichospermum sp. ST_sed2]MDD1472497.1 hypothetical protein [Dolichospermum sp. ST_sed4]
MSEQFEISQTITGTEFAATSASGNATITIYNYYSKEEAKLVTFGSTNTAPKEIRCPYRGLLNFRPNDADFFFGRKNFIDELYEATKTHNFIPVVGSSGSGKSSVVFAGLVPKLKQETDVYWKFTYFRLGSYEDPFYALAMALVPLIEANINSINDKIDKASKLAKSIQNGTKSLNIIFSSIQQNDPNHRVLLIADQFEEIYTVCKDEEIRNKFINCLLDYLNSSTSHLHPYPAPMVLVITMRIDFLEKAISYQPFSKFFVSVPDNQLLKLLCPMSPEELIDIIKLPAQKLGVTVQQELIVEILNDVNSQHENLPLLEFALTELWNRKTDQGLTKDIYLQIGYLKGALVHYADQKYSILGHEQKEEVKRIFTQLVLPGEGTKDTKRIATKEELGDNNWGLVTQLANIRLLVTSKNPNNQVVVELVHEALIDNWGQLRNWIDEKRDFRIWQERLRILMKEWKKKPDDKTTLLHGSMLVIAEEKLKENPEYLVGEQEFITASINLRDEENKQQKRATQKTIVGLGCLSLFLLIFAYFSWTQWQRAEKNYKNLKNANSNLAKVKQEKVSIEKELDRKRYNLDKVKKDKEQASEEVSRLNSQLDKVKKDKEQASEEVSRLNSQKDCLQKKVAEIPTILKQIITVYQSSGITENHYKVEDVTKIIGEISQDSSCQ